MNTIRTFETKFIDELGRERIFNGVNIVDKSDYTPGEQKYCINADDELFERFEKYGINLIRLGFTWAKLEPAPGKYNDEYLDVIDKILDLCAKHNVYVFLDMHQDLYSPVCNGDGAPAWATITDGYEVKPIKGVWAEGYFIGKYCQRAFDNFWDNRKVNGRGLQEWYADCWAHVAERFKNKEALFGFDIMNEPFPGMSAGKAFKALIAKGARVVLFDREIKHGKLIKDALSKDRVPKVLSQISPNIVRKATSVFDECIKDFDINRYAPFMSGVSKAIRGVTDKGIILLENSYWSNTTIPYSAPPITIDGEREPNQAFAPHAYDFMVDTPMYKYASNERVSGMFAQHKKSQDRLGMPVIVGEWGGCGGAGDDWLPHIEYLLSLFDSNKWSNTYWCYSDGWLDSVLMKVFVRPYPKAVAGDIVSFVNDREGKLFTLDFICNSENDTVICVPSGASRVLVDGAEVPYELKASDIIVKTQSGRHKVEVSTL